MSCFLIDCRVPVLTLENLDLRFDAAARVVELAFRSGAAYVLEDDPVGSTTEAAGVGDLAQLRRFLHAGLENHFGPVVQRIRELLPVGSRAAWGNVGDKLIQAAAWIANRCHSRENATESAPRLHPGLDVAREVELLVGRPDSPFFNRRAGLSVGLGGRAEVERGSCCLQYRAPYGNTARIARCNAGSRQGSPQQSRRADSLVNTVLASPMIGGQVPLWLPISPWWNPASRRSNAAGVSPRAASYRRVARAGSATARVSSAARPTPALASAALTSRLSAASSGCTGSRISGELNTPRW